MRRFVIETFPRCGSRMLQTGLDAHAHLRCAGELLNLDSDDYLGEPGVRCEGAAQAALLEAFFAEHSRFAAVGFLLHRAFDSSWQPVDPAALRPVLAGAVVLSLVRRNLLRSCLSNQLARREGEWEHYRGGSGLRDPSPVNIEPSRLDEWVRSYQQGLAQARSLFPDRLEIVYEDLCGDWQASLARVFDRLAVPPQAVQPRSIRVGRPLRQGVANYEELKRHYAGGPFAAWFDE